jgi:hypothetical protein
MQPHGEPTHYLMDGGKLYVRDEAAFLREYAEALTRGEACFVVERRTPVFKLFADLDWTRTEAPSPELWLQLLRVVVDAVRRARGGPPFVMLACLAAPKPDPAGGVRVGAHLHFPDVLVTQALALAVRARLVPVLAALNLEFDAEHLVDPAVYHGNGLRMKGSRKATPCEPCAACGGTGRRVDARVYAPTIVMDDQGALASEAEVRALCADWHAVVRATSIRSDAAEPDAFGALEAVAAPVARSWGRASRLPEALNAHIHASLTRAFPVYADEHARAPWRVTEIVEHGDATSRVMLVHTTCTYCCNKRGHHRSKGNAVYFLVTEREVTQRCFSHKSVPGAEGDVACRTYRTAPQPTPPLLWTTLRTREAPASEPARAPLPRRGVKRSASRAQIGTPTELLDVVL